MGLILNNSPGKGKGRNPGPITQEPKMIQTLRSKDRRLVAPEVGWGWASPGELGKPAVRWGF